MDAACLALSFLRICLEYWLKEERQLGPMMSGSTRRRHRKVVTQVFG
jgi:hypothetical protein